MLAFGISAGLPFALLLGTLYAWLDEAGVDLETMGVFSLIGLAYAFKFLWSPLVDRIVLPGLERLGRRKSWLLPIQIMLGLIFVAMSQLDPKSALGWFSLLAGIGAFASATQDIVIDAWRVDVADEITPVEILSAIYQLGYRLATLIGGALALVLAARIDWPGVYLAMGIAFFVISLITFMAPDTPRPRTDDAAGMAWLYRVPQNYRNMAMAVILLAWAWALFTVIQFMVLSLTASAETRPDSTEFVKFEGPIIVIATVVIPAIIAAFLGRMAGQSRTATAAVDDRDSGFSRAIDYGYQALLMPLMELIGRLKWGVLIALGIILTYRLTDNIWAPFALPFYLGELGYTKDEVAIASKFFGVGMTMLGITLGAFLFAWIGRLPSLVLGSILAAVTNLLYADLALGGAGIDAVGSNIGIYALFELFGADARLARLMLAIAGENLANGIAGAAYVAFLSSITAKEHSAVQYALLSSLTFLIGSLGRGALGKYIETDGYAPMFYLAAGIGVIAIVFCVAEWMRDRWQARDSLAPA
ncbi:MAG: AmpG family muropeptide MFS transporter [Sphingopyxis sp.]|nr:AmpG family muropeptide MFS transporter [Sphingopyxis sp.]